MTDPTEGVFHDTIVSERSIWLVRVYHAAYQPKHYHGYRKPAFRPAQITYEIAQARLGETYSDGEDEEPMPTIGWMSFGTEIPIHNEYYGLGKFVQPLFEIEIGRCVDWTGDLYAKKAKMPEGWVL